MTGAMPMTGPRILIVDDDRDIRELLSQFLLKHGYASDTAADGDELYRALALADYDLVVLDVMLPGDDGFTLCRQLRARSPLPIIMLTAIDEDTDRIVGLEMGADDYVTKPFNPRELLARIKAVLRRAEYARAAADGLLAELSEQADETRSRCFYFNGWLLDMGRRELRTQSPASDLSTSDAGVLVSLTAGEFELLLAFVEHPQRVLSRDQLLDYTKGEESGGFDRSIDVQLSRLRRKIEPNPKEPSLIKTVRGGGYMFTATVTKTGRPQ